MNRARFFALGAPTINAHYGFGMTSPHFSQVRNSSESKNVCYALETGSRA